MKYINKARVLLEYDKVLSQIASMARTEGAAELILKTEPIDDIVVVKRLLAQTAKAKEMIVTKSHPPFGQCKNIIPSLDRASKGAVLTPKELLETASLLRSVSAIRRYPASTDDLGALEPFFGALKEISHLERAISDAIIAEDMIADTASDALYRIRRDIRKCESNVRDTLARYTSGGASKYLQENIVTMRNGRYVVPVKAEHKNEIKGLVHDTSASGATLFIEPLAVLEENNKLRELRVAENDEIERILSSLSSQVAAQATTLALNYKALTDLSAIFAKAEYSYSIRGISPVINEKDTTMKLLAARHPLLDKEKVVPVTVTLGGKNSVLVITGPNTGGKTVALKTLGLFVLMNQSGIEIPCDFGSSLPVFDAVLPDIGDEQSIEQSLSTFSSHMVNIVTIIEQTTNRSLCLFDELGAGTDPTEGAALAIAIIEEEKKNGAVVAATTHYAEIKQYALETDGVINASCEFDVETLKPTYRLIVGLPGKSNAFAISLRLGIPEHIIERAKAVMSDDNVRFEDVITRLQDTESRLSKEKKNAEQLKAEAEKKLAEAETLRKVAEEEAAKAVQKAKEQANRILISAKASSEYILDEVNELKRKAEKEKNFDTLEEARRSIRKTLKETNVESEEAPEDDYVPPRPFRVGDTVMIAGINKEAYITALDGDSATVQAGIIKTKVKTSELRLKDKPVQQQPKKTTLSVSRNSAPAKQEIDVRGQTGDDAYFMIDRFFDSAIMANYHVVTIIHGKGTGALRAAIWAKLRKDKRVKSFRSGSYGEGDFGVTVVEL